MKKSSGSSSDSESLPAHRKVVRSTPALVRVGVDALPILIVEAGESAQRRFIEFFTATIRNKNTRQAYARACCAFLAWMDEHARGVDLAFIQPTHVAAWIEFLGNDRNDDLRHGELGAGLAAPSVKQHLAAVRMMFDWLVTGHIVNVNPAWSVRGPKHVVKKGKTPVLSAVQARELLDSIPLVWTDDAGIDHPDLVGLRDRALIATMVYSFARVGAVVKMDVEDYWQNGKRWWLRLHEKGGKHHEVPCHHNAEAYLDEYVKAAGIEGRRSTKEKAEPLFRTTYRKTGKLTDRRMTANDVLRMIKRRAKVCGLPIGTCCHTFRATGITAYLDNGGTIENAQHIAAHESPRTTKLYDRTKDEITLDEIERIAI
jgi:integrase/recombinase XerD